MMLTTMKKIEYDSVFEVTKAHRMLEKLDGIRGKEIMCMGG
jgi:hypothetical protein